MPPDSKIVSDYLVTIFRDKQSLITTADSKANILLGLIGIILSLFFKFYSIEKIQSKPMIFLIIVPFIGAGLFAFLALFPRTSRKINNKSLLNFQNVDLVSKDEFLKNHNDELVEWIANDYIENTKILSAILAQKFRYLQYAYIFFALGIILKLGMEIVFLV